MEVEELGKYDWRMSKVGMGQAEMAILLTDSLPVRTRRRSAGSEQTSPSSPPPPRHRLDLVGFLVRMASLALVHFFNQSTSRSFDWLVDRSFLNRVRGVGLIGAAFVVNRAGLQLKMKRMFQERRGTHAEREDALEELAAV